MEEELAECGEKIWSKFNRGKDQRKWYMQSLAEVFMSKFDDQDARKIIFKKVDQVVAKIFLSK